MTLTLATAARKSILPQKEGARIPHSPFYHSIHETPHIRLIFKVQDRGTIKWKALYFQMGHHIRKVSLYEAGSLLCHSKQCHCKGKSL